MYFVTLVVLGRYIILALFISILLHAFQNHSAEEALDAKSPKRDVECAQTVMPIDITPQHAFQVRGKDRFAGNVVRVVEHPFIYSSFSTLRTPPTPLRNPSSPSVAPVIQEPPLTCWHLFTTRRWSLGIFPEQSRVVSVSTGTHSV